MAINVNELSKLSDAELEFISQNSLMIKIDRLQNRISTIENDLEKVKAQQKVQDAKINSQNDKINIIEESQTNTDIKVNKLECKIDNFKNDDTGKFELYKATARARVHKLVGEKGSIKYILFYHPFSQKIYSDIYDHFGANNSGNIKMEFADTAISMASTWKPSMKYIKSKLNEYRKMKDGGRLKEPRLTAYDQYMEETEGGINIEF